MSSKEKMGGGSPKQNELPGMPAKTEFAKKCDAIVEAWEEIEDKKKNFNSLAQALIPEMKKHGKTRVVLKDKTGNNIVIEHKTTQSEKIRVRREEE